MSDDPKFMFIQPVTKEFWDSLTPEMQGAFVQGVVHGFVHHTWEAVAETNLDGMRLFPEDEDGNPLPEMIAIRGTIELHA